MSKLYKPEDVTLYWDGVEFTKGFCEGNKNLTLDTITSSILEDIDNMSVEELIINLHNAPNTGLGELLDYLQEEELCQKNN